MTKAAQYSLLGALLSAGAPLGWLLIRRVEGGSALRELADAGGLYVYLSVSTCTVLTVSGAVLGHISDRLMRANRLLAELSLTDPLTGIGNTRYLRQRLAAEVARAERDRKPFAVVVADLDRFKALNDAQGHAAGDRALAWASDALRHGIRSCDVACRMGGDEFVVLCPGAGADEGAAIAERIRALLAAGAARVGLTASLGVAVHLAGAQPEDVLERADAALYAAKRAGGNQVRMDSRATVRGLERRDLASANAGGAKRASAPRACPSGRG